MELEEWMFVIQAVVFVAIPVLLFVEIYIGHMDYAGFLQRCGFARREVGLLLVGGLVGIVLGPLGLYGVPLFIYRGSLLAIDLGGAIIPIVLSIYLIKIKKLNIPAFVGAVAIISVITFMSSEFRPPLGIVSEFPYYLFPSFTGIALALIVYKQKITEGIPFAYSTTTFGVLIGADIVRIPQVLIGLEEIREELDLPIAAGSIGGAGGLDLVFLGGLMAIAPLFFLAPRHIRRAEERITPSMVFDNSLKKTLFNVDSMYEAGNYQGAVEGALRAVDMKIKDLGYKFGINQSPYNTLDMLQVNPYLRNDYWLLENASKYEFKTQNDAYRAILTARYIIRELKKVETKLYATSGQRMVAFLLDSAIITGIVISFFYLGGALGVYNLAEILTDQNFIWFIAFIMWLWVAQVVYFTIFEGWKGQSPGKRLVGIKVTSDEHAKCDFMDAFTRNVVRLLDIVLFVYLVSLVMMSLYPKRQRIGDFVAKTVVLRA
ncbi:MAG: RDD family protein [Thermoplasmata archaeon]|nr:MAG: RDD family protein [Thermoplasmata archaeon]